MSFNGTTVRQPPPFDSPYHYIPTRSVTLIFVSLFGLSTALHIGQAIHSRLWWLFPTLIIAGLGEVAGWSGRLWSTYNIPNNNAFMLQLVVTILAPTPMLAANFMMLGHIVLRLGTSYSRLAPRLYSIIFVSCDVLSLVIQGIGGGFAAGSNDQKQTDMGGNIMLAGIVLQLVVILAYISFASEFFFRFAKDRPLRSSRQQVEDNFKKSRVNIPLRLKIMTCALGFSTLCLVIRGIYRVIELAGGWNGRILHTQIYFNVLDGAMVVLAIYTTNFVHPGMFLHYPRIQPTADDEYFTLNHRRDQEGQNE